MRSSALLLPAAVISAMLLLSGCSGTGAETESETAESPLSEYFNAVYGGDLSPEEHEEQARADEKEREELISLCMTEQGFEYIPAVQSTSFTSSGAEWLPDDEEWVSQYGYAMVNYPGSDDTAPVDEYVDPNAEYVGSLSESEQQAFYEALNGPPIPEEELSADMEYQYDWTTAGCYGEAQHAMEGEDPTQSDEHKPLFDAMSELYTQVESAPELANLNAAWASCMSNAGQPGFTTQADAQNSMSEKYNALWESQTSEEAPSETVTDALAEDEIELALVDLDCREQTDYREKHSELQVELEQQFVDEHKAELEALKADAEQGN